MATLQTIVYKAFREIGVTAVGDIPEGTEYAEGFAQLQDILNTIPGYEHGENLTDINIGSASTLNASGLALDSTTEITTLYVPNNVRLVCNLTAPVTVYLHPKPREGDRVSIIDAGGTFATKNLTVQGNGRSITVAGVGASSFVMSTNGQSAGFFYRADLSSWVPFDVSSDTLPTPYAPSFDDMFSLILAKRIAPRYGATWQPQQEESLQRMWKMFRARYRQETQVGSEWAIVRLPSVKGSYNYFSTSSSNFSKGFIP